MSTSVAYISRGVSKLQPALVNWEPRDFTGITTNIGFVSYGRGTALRLLAGARYFFFSKDPEWLWRPHSQLGSGQSCVGIAGLKTDASLLKVTMSLSFVHLLVLKVFCYEYETVDEVHKPKNLKNRLEWTCWY
jgi:hypothetical protein